MTKATERAYDRAVKFVRGRFEKLKFVQDRDRCAAQIGRVVSANGEVIVATDGVMAVTVAPSEARVRPEVKDAEPFKLKMPDVALVGAESVATTLKRMKVAAKPYVAVRIAARAGMLRVQYKGRGDGDCIEATDYVPLRTGDDADDVIVDVDRVVGAWDDRMELRVWSAPALREGAPIAMVGEGFTVWLMPMRE